MTVEHTTPVTDQQTDPTFITKRDVTAQAIRDAAGRNLVESKKVQKILQELKDLMAKQPDKAEDIVKQAVIALKRNAQELARLIDRREYQGHEPKELENNAEIQTEVGHNESKKDDTMSQTTHVGAPTGSNTSARLTISDVGTALKSQEKG
ncbi:hypothetical protein QFC21_001891 [Naganishia friedmannii]|uniref:Uncharacterized protein n=1 Tax=Naganishia friedmannii TaxID=89922 RepID=A0ACC2W1A2_9TREE|nr:hypothetical protein QFC21_001891 [Naganishia friedmannii]